MTLDKAIEILTRVSTGERFTAFEIIEASEYAVKVLNKQKPRNIKLNSIPLYRTVGGKIVDKVYMELCPCCNSVVEHKDKYCYWCGQKLTRGYSPKIKNLTP